MAVGSFDQDTIDRVITAALDAGLADPARRIQLLAHLPARFVDKIEPAAEPAEQLRIDVQHLNDHPRLPDHHQPPLASWLQNAYLAVTPSPQARIFRDLRGRLVGSGRQQEILRSITRIKRITVPEELRRSPDRAPAPDPRAGTLLGGRFTLDAQLGEGAVATVWRANDLATGTQVAVKILHRRWAEHPERRARFFAGARQMAQFAHPHIVPVILPEGRDAGCCYCVLEYLDAGDLEAALREGRIRRSAALRALLKVASGVAAMHAAGVMHLDLKPQNILLATDGRVMLGDFDRVRNAATEGGSTTDTVESIFYLAPETFDDTRRPGPAADVFSLGMTALFVLHGDKLPAWIVRRPTALLRRIECPDGLRQVIGQAIELEPGARQADIETLAVAMQEALGRSPTDGLARVAPLASPRPVDRAHPRTPVPTSTSRARDGRPPVATITGEHAALVDSEQLRSLSRSGALPAISAAQAFDAEAASVGGSMDGGGRDLPPPSMPPPSLPAPDVELPPARTGELILEDSIDSALEMLDRAAAAALAEEFARQEALAPQPDGSGSFPGDSVHDSALLPAPGGESPIDPIDDSIDLEGPAHPHYSAGHHVSIPGDENRSPWQWVERSGGFMIADDPATSDEHSISGSSMGSFEQPPARSPWHWSEGAGSEMPGGSARHPHRSPGGERTDPAPAVNVLRDDALRDDVLPDDVRPIEVMPDDVVADDGVADDAPAARPPIIVPPQRTPQPAPQPAPVTEGALPLDLPPEVFEPPPAGATAEQAFVPPPRDRVGLATPQAEPDRPPISETMHGAALQREEAPTDPATRRPPLRTADPTEPVPPDPAPVETSSRRRFLAVAGFGALGAAVTWWLTRPGCDPGPIASPRAGDGPRAPRPAAAPPDAVAAPEPLDRGLQPDAAPIPDAEPDAAPIPDAEPDAAPIPDATPDAAPIPDAEPDAAPIPDAEPDAAPIPDAMPDAAPPPPRRRRRRKRRRKPKPKPKPTPEPLIEIPDEIQRMLDE